MPLGNNCVVSVYAICYGIYDMKCLPYLLSEVLSLHCSLMHFCMTELYLRI